MSDCSTYPSMVVAQRDEKIRKLEDKINIVISYLEDIYKYGEDYGVDIRYVIDTLRKI